MCPNCGVLVERRSKHGNEPVYCSSTCRSTYWARTNGQTRTYVKMFKHFHGEPPYWCAYCESWIESLAKNVGVVHHLDHNRKNGDILNLAPVHHGCHSKLHQFFYCQTEQGIEAKRKAGRTRHE